MREKYLGELQKVAGHALGAYRNGKDLEDALKKTHDILDADDTKNDDLTSQSALAIHQRELRNS